MSPLQVTVFSLVCDLDRIGMGIQRHSEAMRDRFCLEAKRWLKELSNEKLPDVIQIDLGQISQMVKEPGKHSADEYIRKSKVLLEYGLSLGEI